jgi:hypothetical protein
MLCRILRNLSVGRWALAGILGLALGSGMAAPTRLSFLDDGDTSVQAPVGPKKRISKSTAIGVMVAGGLMIVIPWFFVPSGQESSFQIVKTVVGAVGFCILCVGAYYRP